MKIKYISPVILHHKLNILAQGLYVFIVTLENCPGLASSDKDLLSENTFSHCDNDDLATIQGSSDGHLLVTCSNIGGSYTITIYGSETELGGDLNCLIDQISVTAPFSVSPALPADCVVNSIFDEDDPGNGCLSQG